MLDHRMSDIFMDDDDFIDDDMPESRRKMSFLTAKNSQEIISTHLDTGFGHRVRHAVASLFFGKIHVRLLCSVVVACFLAAVCCLEKVPDTKQDVLDLCVFNMIYGTWLVFCVPMLIACLNLHLVYHILHIMYRLFFAEIAVMAYAYYRGHNNVLRRGFSLFPTLEANRPGKGLAWLGEVGYNLRLASLISCFIIACVITAMEVWANQSME